MYNKKIIFLVVALVALIAGCGSIWDTESVGIGTDFTELKKSPCACIQLENKPGLPDWLMAS